MTLVTGTYRHAENGVPSQGYIRFTLQPGALDADGAQRTCQPVYAPLDAQGSFSIDLVPDSDLTNVDGTAVYEVAEFVDDCRRGAWFLVVEDGTPIDLPSRYPGDALGQVAVVPVPGDPGDPGASAYDLAVEAGFEGTEAEWLASLNGPPNSLTIGTVSTLPPGSPATADVTGTAPDQTLSLGVPQGEPGPTSARTSRPNGTDRLVEVWDGSGWVVTHYDSGWRDVTGLLQAGWTISAGSVRLRRVNSDVFVLLGQSGFVAAAAGVATDTMLNLPSGFRSPTNQYSGFAWNGSNAPVRSFQTSSGAVMIADASKGGSYRGLIQYPVDDTLPTSLPGTPIGTAP